MSSPSSSQSSVNFSRPFSRQTIITSFTVSNSENSTLTPPSPTLSIRTSFFFNHSAEVVPTRNPTNASNYADSLIALYNYSSSDSDYTTAMHDSIPPYTGPLSPPHAQHSRYYAHALTPTERSSLASGVQNHNHRSWTHPSDLLLYHASRLHLTDSMNPAVKQNVEEWLDHQQRIVEKAELLRKRKRQRVSKIPGLLRRKTVDSLEKLDNVKGTEQMKGVWGDEVYGTPHAAWSTPMLRSHTETETMVPLTASVPAVPQIRVSSARPATVYQPFEPSPVNSRSSSATRNSVYIHSTLTPLGTARTPENHTPRPEITFDAFLAPHKSGKGEAYRGAENADMAGKGKKNRWSRLFRVIERKMLGIEKGRGWGGGVAKGSRDVVRISGVEVWRGSRVSVEEM
ncbi:hypothetical protein M011DRAFT_525143 [Sporormia fimetaria CBS 119925]|uniref:Uncharacterized protein n=1 Tax=Sporormia fimetaria CBS 119925 TaxID=1340428 RepID=A0A6A6VHE9_9PLEO|nr:hypothetical protein M011DRAFT_525143 [Sporormia fimetaria CBS 119925]